MRVTFKGQPREVAVLPDHGHHLLWPNHTLTDAIRDEPMLYSATVGFAYQHGGPLTEVILDALETQRPRQVVNRVPVIDTRVHMLMPGQYPAIPGWHCDDVPRRNSLEGGNGQPELLESSGEELHYVCTVSDTCDFLDSGGHGGTGPSRTEFLVNPVTVEVPGKSDHVWKDVHEAVEATKPEIFQARHQRIYGFSQQHLHRAPRTTCRNWRFFFRLSYMRDDQHRRPEVRKQVQVYTTEGGGW